MRTLFLVVVLICTPWLVAAQDAPLVYQGENTLYRDTVWTGDVTIDGILTVAAGVTLEIRPGTIVRFTFADTNNDAIGENELFVQGTLRAVGAELAPIIFTSAQDQPRRGDWGAINMMATETESLFEHCRIEYAYRGFHAHFARARLRNSELRHNYRAAQFQDSTVAVESCHIHDNFNGIQFRDSEVTLLNSVFLRNHWGARCVFSTVYIDHCLVEDNLLNGMNFRGSDVTLQNNLIRNNRRGLYFQESQVKAVANQIVGNSEHGILLEKTTGDVTANLISAQGRAGVKVVNSSVDLTGNSIVANGEYALINEGLNDFNAQQNWWGTTSNSSIALLIRDQADRPTVGAVVFSSPLNNSPELYFER